MAEIKVMTAGPEGVFAELKLPVKSAAIKRDEGAADMLELKLWGEVGYFPTFLKLWQGEDLIFEGIVDDMISSSDEDGVLTELVARDKVSLLTDNQMRPCTLRNPSLQLFAEKYLKPLGFTALGNKVPFRGEMKIDEGTSVLRGLREFCRDFMGTEPQIRGDVIYCDGGRPQVRVPQEYPVISQERTLSRFGLPSKIYMKNSRSAAYSGCRENPDDLGFTRVVYGEGDFQVKRKLELLLAGYAPVLPGDIYGRLRAEFVRLNFGKDGWTTRISGEEI